jgi:hypothetical protein
MGQHLQGLPMRAKPARSVSAVETRGVQASPMKDDRTYLPASFQPAAPVHDFEAFALKCRTPKQFHELLNRLHAFIPYKNLICSWGYPSSATLGFVFNHSFPREFVRWYLTKGMLWKSPVFQEWLQTKRTQV